MIFQLHIPSPPLNQFVESFVYFKGVEPVHDYERFLPDGNTHLVMDLTENHQCIYDNETLKEIQICRRVWFSGIRTQCITIPSGKGSENFIVNFHKGKAYPFVNAPLHAFADIVVDGEQVHSPAILSLREKIIDAPTVIQKFWTAEHGLLQLFANNFMLAPVVDFAVASITKAPHLQSIEGIINQTGYSQKHFIKLFKEKVGLTPKSFLKVIRFQKAITEIEQSLEINWTHVAHDCGYYDQAHFINDFKDFSGYTPTEYVQKKSEQLNYVPIN